MTQKTAAVQRELPEKDREKNGPDRSQTGSAEAVPAATTPVGNRFWEVDSWRGVAIITMVIFHLVFDLRNFGGMPFVLHEGFWFYFQRFTAISFITLAGVSVVLSYNRALSRTGTADGLAWKVARRGLHILGIGLILSLVMTDSRSAAYRLWRAASDRDFDNLLNPAVEQALADAGRRRRTLRAQLSSAIHECAGAARCLLARSARH